MGTNLSHRINKIRNLSCTECVIFRERVFECCPEGGRDPVRDVGILLRRFYLSGDSSGCWGIWGNRSLGNHHCVSLLHKNHRLVISHTQCIMKNAYIVDWVYNIIKKNSRSVSYSLELCRTKFNINDTDVISIIMVKASVT